MNSAPGCYGSYHIPLQQSYMNGSSSVQNQKVLVEIGDGQTLG